MFIVEGMELANEYEWNEEVMKEGMSKVNEGLESIESSAIDGLNAAEVDENALTEGLTSIRDGLVMIQGEINTAIESGELDETSLAEWTEVRDELGTLCDGLNETLETGEDSLTDSVSARQESLFGGLSAIKDRFTNMFDAVDEHEMAPCMEIQAEEISEAFLENPELKFENWEKLSLDEKVEALQRFEDIIAEIEHRPAATILAEEMDAYGYYDHSDATLHLNIEYLSSNDFNDYKETLDTLFHEGRHAYQNHNAFSGEVVEQNESYVQAWTANLDSDIWGYKAAEIYGLGDYYMQPVEVDARAFAEAVLDKIELR